MIRNLDVPTQGVRVFVSYSHDSPRHKARVLELSNRLREGGIDCQIDAYYEAPPEGWPRWMLNQVEDTQYVVVVCTETYERRFRGKDERGRGKGAKWEGAIITQQLYNAELHNTKFIPVLLNPEDEPHIPIVLQGATYYDTSTEAGYLKLYRRLTGQPEIDVPLVAESIHQMPPTDIVGQQRSAEAREKLKQARQKFDLNDFETTVKLSEEGGVLAKLAGDEHLQRKALLQLVRALGEQVMSPATEEADRKKLVALSHQHIDALERLSENPGTIALERALVARLEGNAEEALKFADSAASLAEGDFFIQADALIARLHAFWQLDRAMDGLAFSEDVERVRNQAEDDPKVVLDATWLRTLCKSGKVTETDVKHFIETVRFVLGRKTVSRDRLAMVINQVESEFGRADRMEDRLVLCELAYEVIQPLHDSRKLALISLQAAELSAALGDARRARLHVGQADSWIAQTARQTNDKDDQSKPTFEAMNLFARARALTRLADNSDFSAELYQEAYEALKKANDFANHNRLNLAGNVELYLADLSWWLGRTAINLGHIEEGAKALRAVRSEAAMSNPHFASEVGVKAWGLEVEALALSGRLSEASVAVDALLADPTLPEASKNRPRRFRRFLDQVVQPTVDWFRSSDALKIQRIVTERSLSAAVGEQTAPLISWWKEWQNKKAYTRSPHSELLDFWGRGGFSRVAVAVRARPHATVAVDARTLDDIRKYARIFCPLFETVIVKWKGELDSGLVITPIHEAYGDGPDDFGGHGYMVTAGSVFTEPEEQWHPALSWANPLPQDVTSFLAGEALPLFKAGRLVVLPAPLVGCTQRAIGWTDSLLIESFLGGVVNVARREGSPTPLVGRQRILDITKIQIPFVDNVPLGDLAKVLDETEPWVGSLRSLLFKAMSSEDLNYERWDRVAALEYDIRDACRELQEHLNGFAVKHRQQEWNVSNATGEISAGERGTTPPAHEPITGLLQTLSSARRELSPWIPYLRLQDHGGYLHWTCPLDNPSKPPDSAASASLAAGAPKGPELQTWLYPGTAGWAIPTGITL